MEHKNKNFFLKVEILKDPKLSGSTNGYEEKEMLYFSKKKKNFNYPELIPKR